MADEFYKRVNYGTNFLAGILCEQLYSTFGNLPYKIRDKISSSGSQWEPPLTIGSAEWREQENIESWGATGVVVGGLFDIVTLGYAIKYLAGDDHGDLARYAAILAGVKIGLQATSFFVEKAWANLENRLIKSK